MCIAMGSGRCRESAAWEVRIKCGDIVSVAWRCSSDQIRSGSTSADRAHPHPHPYHKG